MAFTIDTSNSASNGSANTLTIALTLAGANEILVVMATGTAGTGDPATMTAVWNGTESLTRLDTQFVFGSDASFYLVNPTSGAHNVVITYAGTGYVSAYAVALIGQHTVTPINDHGVGTVASTTITKTVNTTIDGCYVFDIALEQSANALSDNSGQTNILANTGTYASRGGYKLVTTAGSYDASYTTTAGTAKDIVVLAIAPPSATSKGFLDFL